MEYIGLLQLVVDLVRLVLGNGGVQAESDAVYRLIRAAQDAHAARRFGASNG